MAIFKRFEKKFTELKTFEDWLKWKQTDKANDKAAAAFLIIMFVAVFAFIFGVIASVDSITDDEQIACSAVGMEHITHSSEDFCVDSKGVFHEVDIQNGKVYINKGGGTKWNTNWA